MTVSVVILNWNTKEYLRRFLPGLIASCEGLDAEVVVADNGSTDGSMEMLAEEFPDVARIGLDRNYGFTGGYNRALEKLDSDFFVLLNTDVEVSPDWLRILLKWMEEHPECGICGPKLLSYDERGRFEYAGAAGGYIDVFGYPYCRGRVLKKVEEDRNQYDTPENVMWVSGACLMIRRSLWESLGGLDDSFFAHMEEIDLCWRAQLEGFKVQSVPESKVYHIGGGTLSNDSPWKLKLNFRNNLLMLRKNLPRTVGRLRTGLILFFRMALDGLAALAYLLKGRKDCFKSVVEAHNEYREMKRSLRPQYGKREIDGCLKGSIFIKYLTV